MLSTLCTIFWCFDSSHLEEMLNSTWNGCAGGVPHSLRLVALYLNDETVHMLTYEVAGGRHVGNSGSSV